MIRSDSIEKRIDKLESLAHPPACIIVDIDQTREMAVNDYEQLYGPLGSRDLIYIEYN